MKDFRQTLLATFLVEHNEHVQRIRETLAAVEDSAREPASTDLDEAFRRAHSLKGAARAVDLRAIEHLAHRLETLFARVRAGAVPLDQPVIKVIHQALDASEDWLASRAGAQEPGEPVQALEAIDALLSGSGARSASMAPAAAAVSSSAAFAPAPALGAASFPMARDAPFTPVAPSAAVAAAATVRLHADRLDRIVNSSGQLITESLRQQQVTRRLRHVSRRLADAAAERARARKRHARAFRQLEAAPELAAAARYMNFLDHQVQLLTRQVGAAVRLQERNAWTLRSLAAELQHDVRQARMVPADSVFDGFRKMVRDLARDEGKSAELHVSGRQVLADRVVLQALKDPVMHVLRNAIGHGLESASERTRRGKPPEGRIDLVVEARGNQLHVAVEDDGRGVDAAKVREIALRKKLISPADADARPPEELTRLILLPGFSTAQAVNELSGRGMGLSVVAEAAARLQGKVEIGAGARGGARVTIVVPLSVSSHRLLLVTCHDQTFAMPLHGIERLHRVPLREVQTVESRPVIRIDGQLLPIVSLAHLVETGEAKVTASHETVCVLIMRVGARRLAVAVDGFLAERDAIVKDLPAPANTNPKIAGGILLEDGSVCLVLNPAALVQGFEQSASALAFAAGAGDAADAAAKSRRILVVDDSLTTRTLEKSVLEAHGYDVTVAVDGIEALQCLRGEPFGLVITDLEMPRLGGLGLLEEMKRDGRLAAIPVVIVSSIENEDDQARGMALGADAYIVKRRFEQRELLETIRQIL